MNRRVEYGAKSRSRGRSAAALLLVLSLACGVAGARVAGAQAATGNPTEVPAAEASFQQAQRLASHGRLEAAMAVLNVLAQKQPEPAGVERLRGEILYQKQMLVEANVAFARALAEDPADRESMEMRGVTLYRLARPAEAIPLLERANAVVSSANIDPEYVLGLCYMDVKRYDDARHAFAQQFGFAADSPAAYVATARLLLRREFTAEAIAFVQHALAVDPKLPMAHQLLGEIALAQADLPKAIAELESEERLNPLNGNLYEHLGDAYVRSGQYEKARKVLNRAILLEPNDTGPYILLGEALTGLGEPAEAVHYLAHAEQMDPGNAVTHTQLGRAYRAMGERALAAREYETAVAIQHRNDPKPPQTQEK